MPLLGAGAIGAPILAGTITHLFAGLAFSFLSIFLAVAWSKGRREVWLLGASAATAIWAWATAYHSATSDAPETIVQLLEIARNGIWLALLLSVVMPVWGLSHRRIALIATPIAVGLLCLAILAYDASRFFGSIPPAAPDGTALAGVSFIGRLLIAIIGLLLIENLYRNMRPDYRWTVKALCLGIGGLFAYDFFMYSDALLFKQLDPQLSDLRGIVTAVVAFLIAVHLRSHPERSLTIHVSRQAAFHTATFVGAGVYLLLMWAAALYLRQFGGAWGGVLQGIFLIAAFVVLSVILFSSGYRAWLKLFISKHFFRYRFDYRGEWLRLIDTISSTQHGAPLAEKVIQGIANIVESPEGILWLVRDRRYLEPGGAWQTGTPARSHPVDPAFIAYFEDRQWIIDLADRPEHYADLTVPAWIATTRHPWLLVPLIRDDSLLGLVALDRSHAPRALDWEDFDLLRTVGRQAAHFLAEQRAAKALADSQQFDQFNRRFAFVLHDIKNLVSQLTLLLANAQKHRENREFQEDMLETIQESVTKMNHLLVRLHQGGRDAATDAAIRLAPFLRRSVERHNLHGGGVTLVCEAEDLAVLADEERLSAVMTHLMENAEEAVDGDGSVGVRLHARGDEAIVDITDDGPGMDSAFISERLFQPFVSTKGGYGIGAYECRQYVRDMGGRIEVTSVPGEGTTFKICLPLLAATIHDSGAKHQEPAL